jgi:hypothetical protein
MARGNALYETLEELVRATEGDTLTFGDLVRALGARGFGPIFLLLAVLVMLPTGAIPGIPALVGAVLVLLSGQLMIGWTTPWLPRRVLEMEISRERMRAGLEKARPAALRLGRVLHARLEFLASGPLALRAAAAAVTAAGLVMIPLGFIPLMPFFLGLPVLAIGLGLMARDGLFVSAGFAAFAPVIWLLVRQFG